MPSSQRFEAIKSFLGATLGCFTAIVVGDKCVRLLQLNGGSYGNYGNAGAILILAAFLSLAVAMFFGRRWRHAKAETAGALLGMAIALSLVIAARHSP